MPGYGHKTPRLCVALGFTMFFLLRERLSHSVSPLLEKVSVAIAFAADKKAPLPGKLCPSLCLGALSSSCPLQRLPHNQTASYYLFSWSREVKSSRIASHASLGYFWLLFMNEVASLSTMSVASVRKFEERRPSSLKPLRIHHSPQALNKHSPIPPLAGPSPPSCPDPLFLAYRLWDSDKSTFLGWMKDGKIRICVLRLQTRLNSQLHSVCQSGKSKLRRNTLIFSKLSLHHYFTTRLVNIVTRIIALCAPSMAEEAGPRGREGVIATKLKLYIKTWPSYIKHMNFGQEAESAQHSSWCGILSMSINFRSHAQST